MSVYLHIYISINMYIFKKRTRVGHAFYSKECNVLHSFAFFCIRTLTLRSFTFFAKECCVLWFFYVLCKRMLHSLHSFTFLKKERKRTMRSEHKRPRCPTLGLHYTIELISAVCITLWNQSPRCASYRGVNCPHFSGVKNSQYFKISTVCIHIKSISADSIFN